MMNGGVVLVNTSLMVAGSNATNPVRWNGGQGVLVITAVQLAPVISLNLVGVGAQNRTVKVNSGAIVSDGVYPMMLPAGNYQIHSATGSSISLFAGLYPTP